MDNMKILLGAMSADELRLFQKSINRTRRRAIPFSINGRTQMYRRVTVKEYVDVLARGVRST